jgi:phage tail tape-measure protein
MDPELTDEHERNSDPLSGESGSHPVGVGVGTVIGGAATGAALGTAAGPIGAVAGVVAGGVVGALTGKAVAESVSPSVEGARTRPYPGEDRRPEDYLPAYRFGAQAQALHPSARFEEVEDSLCQAWEVNHPDLRWGKVRSAVRDGWEHIAIPAVHPNPADAWPVL